MTVVDLLTGRATFTADVPADGIVHLVFVRSPFAAAHIRSIDTSAARGAPGVLAVYTAADLDVVPVWEIALIPENFAQPVLATDVVRYAGERVVAVVAESLAAAIDAAELVVVDYEPVPAVTSLTESDSVCLAWPMEDDGRSFPGDDVHVVVDNWIPRLSAAPLEGHAVLAVPDSKGSLTVWASSQVPTATHRQLVRSLGIAADRLRVVVPFVGGGFGGKAAGGVVDHMVACAVALDLNRPVRYVEDRTANLGSMQGRGVSNTVELHASSEGVLTGVRAHIVCDAGAYPSVGAVEPGKTKMMICGPYRIEHAAVDARAVVTNLPPVGAYRGPGRSEAAIMLEGAVDMLAADLGVDPVELRRRNVLTRGELPHKTPAGVEYDSGDFPALLDLLTSVSDYDQLRADQARRRMGGGALLGIGVSMVVDSSAWFARTEGAAVHVEPDGTVVVRTGSAAAGQHHDELYRAIVRSVLPVDAASVRVIEGDTDAWSQSDGTMGSRTAQVAGAAVLRATELVDGRLRQQAAALLEADVDDIVVYEGRGFGVRGVPASALPIAALVADADPIEASCVYEQEAATYPSAAHLSVVEVDPETGRVTPVRHVCVTDCGTVLDPPSARSQVIGATVQGIAQALYEESVFDADGNLLTSTLADYCMPSAAEVPDIETHFLECPSPRNPLGAKGVGEIGMVAAPVAVQNAVVDAIRHLGVRHLDMPCTPQRVWTAMRPFFSGLPSS